ncbi:MAG: type ISP restriction/modification enzyme [Melioribacteraceae bacterium]
MSRVLINQYYNNLDRAIQFGKSTNEQSVRNQFWLLLNEYARKQNYEVIPEVFCLGTKGKKVYPDGIVKNLFGLDIGLWESKDEKDTIDDEIDAKLKKGYPFTNILFEDTNVAVLYQHGEEVKRVPIRDADKLHSIISDFISFKSETVFKFEDALEKFKADIPAIVETLRKRIDDTRVKNKKFIEANSVFLELCKAEINPEITEADIREMMIQHILTSDIFNKIFDDPEFHRHNNIARELEKLIEILFTYAERKNLMGNIEHYYDSINAAASGITDHHEKQKFLKVLYENFYKVYNPKAADRLGVVYTPNEIVQFMIESTDYLLHKHFGKTLADKNVDILDPASGTGTFITSIIDHIPKQNLVYKYNNELHANEVAILPYYIANLNVEFTFKQKMGYYEEFKNLCFVDTLDNTDANAYAGKQHSLFGLTSENSERIKRQNSKKISVIIGNPPYNANQANENDNNKNREYPSIDKRIKDTYIKYSTAQKTKVYDMYARFYRWASDRLDKNGVLAFITNRSFIDSRTFDGFRKCIQDDFNECYIIDTRSDVRANPKIAGTTHNVFGIQTGVALMFLVKKETQSGGCKIYYNSLQDDWRKEIKLEWLRNHQLANIHFEDVSPDKNNNWINLTDNDFDKLISIGNKQVKSGKDEKGIFKLFSSGVLSGRDEWVVDFTETHLSEKITFYIMNYNLHGMKQQHYDTVIKWSRNLKRKLEQGLSEIFDEQKIENILYRPFSKFLFYNSKLFVDERGAIDHLFTMPNKVIAINLGNRMLFNSIATDAIPNYSLYSLDPCHYFPLYRYTESGERIENITDWGLEQFRNNYCRDAINGVSKKGDGMYPVSTKSKKITKEDIFHYTYAVLHNPAYRKKYELNLKREFPRIPFYSDFWQWAEWGKELMELHINYETVKPFALRVILNPIYREKNLKDQKTSGNETSQAVNVKTRRGVSLQEELNPSQHELQPRIKVKLKADKEAGTIELDEQTQLTGIPKEAWEYKLGNRSALEWILDQYKEKKPSDPTIAEKFNTYRFADYKEHVIDLLKRVCTVSVETMKIVRDMEKD